MDKHFNGSPSISLVNMLEHQLYMFGCYEEDLRRKNQLTAPLQDEFINARDGLKRLIAQAKQEAI